MKRIFRCVLSLVAVLLCQAAVAAPAVVNDVTGTVQAIPTAGAPRTVRKGDDVNQGETIVTGANSNVTLLFEDGQIVALSSNSRMAVTAYSYNRADAGKSNILLSLAEGGMRAITGLIGKSRPESVSYRVRNATIGIRGTDITIGTVAGNLFIKVVEGEISFEFQGKTTTVKAGEGIDARADGTVRKAALAAFVDSLSPELKAIFSDMDKITLDRLIRQAGQQDLRDNPTSPLGTQNTRSNNNAGTTGGGSNSASRF